MLWTKDNYPDSMKNLPKDVRDKAIEMVIALLEESKMEEGISNATTISGGKVCAATLYKCD